MSEQLRGSSAQYLNGINDFISDQSQIDKEVHEMRQFLKKEAEDLNLPQENTFVIDNDKAAKKDNVTADLKVESSSKGTGQTKPNSKTTNQNKQEQSKNMNQNSGRLTPLTRGTPKEKPQTKSTNSARSHSNLSLPATSNKTSGMKTKDSRLPRIENKSVVRLQSSKSDGSSLSNESDKDEEPVINRAQIPNGPKRPNKRRRHKPAFLTSLDSSSSTGDLNASDVEYGVPRTRVATRPRSRSQETQRTPMEQDKLTVALQRAQNTSATTLRQMDRCKDIIRELRQDRDDVVRRNEVLSARIENLSDHLTRMSQAQTKRVVQPRRTTAIQVGKMRYVSVTHRL